MEQITIVQRALEYIEENLTLIQDISEIAKRIDVPGSDLQNSFNVMVGYSLSEYIRNRRLYEAAKEIVYSSEKVIDVALKYGYESPDSFTKAFYRFHGVLPSKIVKNKNKMKVFSPIVVDHYVSGGFDADYQIEQRYAFKLIGLSYDVEEREIEKLREEHRKNYGDILSFRRMPQGQTEEIIAGNRIGEFGIYDKEHKRYIIAGQYMGGEFSDKFSLYEFEPMKWAVCERYVSVSLSAVMQMEQMMAEDIAGKAEYRIKGGVRIERYSTFAANNKKICCTVELPLEEEKNEKLLAGAGFKIVNIISVILIIIAMIIAGSESHRDMITDEDAGVLCSIAQYAAELNKAEGGNG